MENEVKVEEGTTSQSVQQVQPQMSGSPVEPVKTKKKGHGPLYWVIVIAGVAFIVYMSIRIGEKLAKVVDPETTASNNSNVVAESNSNTESNSNVEVTKDTELENFNAATATKEINDKLGAAFCWGVFTIGKNSFDDAKARNIVVAMLLQSQSKEVVSENIQEGIRYIDYTTFDKEHQLVFGTNYKTEKEIETNTDIVSVIGQNKVTWLFQGVPSNVSVAATDIKYDETNLVYVISGTYTNEDETGTKTSGTFTLSYNKKDDNRYLKSIVFNKN